MKKLFISLLLLVCALSLKSQSEYLDKDFGDEGTITLEFPGTATSIYHISYDREGNTYVTFQTTDNFSGNEICLYKINKEGILDNNFGDQGIYCIPNPAENQNIAWLGQEHEFIIENDFQRDSIVRIYDLQLNLLTEYNLSITANYGNNIHLTKDQLLYANNQHEIHRYKSNGELDQSFGNNGILKTSDMTEDSLILYIVKSIEGDNLFATSFNISEDGYQSEIIKIQDNGTVDESFGFEGFANIDDSFYHYDISKIEDGYLVHSINTDTSCIINIRFTIKKITNDGIVDESFGYDGALPAQEDCSNKYLFNYLGNTLTDGKIMAFYMNYDIINDTLTFTHSAFDLYDSFGIAVEDFGMNGSLILDFLPANHIYTGIIDKKNNAFLGAISEDRTKAYISKFDFNSLSDKPVSNTGNIGFGILNNPSEGDFILDYQGIDRNEVSISLYDMIGRLITSTTYYQITQGDQFQFTQYELVPATYVLKVGARNEATLFSEQVIVIK